VQDCCMDDEQLSMTYGRINRDLLQDAQISRRSEDLIVEFAKKTLEKVAPIRTKAVERKADNR
jgi:hypothetical protein